MNGFKLNFNMLREENEEYENQLLEIYKNYLNETIQINEQLILDLLKECPNSIDNKNAVIDTFSHHLFVEFIKHMEDFTLNDMFDVIREGVFYQHTQVIKKIIKERPSVKWHF